jgi:TRAP transporter TAXI family solute receptor
MKAKCRITTIFLVFAMFFSFSASLPAEANDYVWGSASLGSRGYVIIEALVSTVNRHTDLRNSSISTAGGMENLALLAQEEIQFGQAQSSDMYFATNALGPFKQKVEFAQVLAYTFASLPVVAMANSDIRTVHDLKGKKVLVGPAGGAAVPIIRSVFEEYGISDSITYVYLSWAEGPEAFKMGQVDAAAVWHSDGVTAHTGFQQVALTHQFRVVEMEEEILRRVAAKNDGISVGVVKKEAFPFYEKDEVAPGVTVGVVCDPKLPEDLIYKITKTLLDNEEEVRSIAPDALQAFGLNFALKGLVKTYPVHPGAARYYKEKNEWTDEYVMYK